MKRLSQLDPCVHCGFCLQACPTYLITGDEADSPRGRIVLMQSIARGSIPPDDHAAISHLDTCLGCRGCEPVCPSGVRYGEALEEIRVELNKVRPASWVARLASWVLAEKKVRRPVLALARLMRPGSKLLANVNVGGSLARMLAASAPWEMQSRPARKLRYSSTTDPDACLFVGCVMEGLFSHVNLATMRTLTANGISVGFVERQSCCGALHAHNGFLDGALRLARRNIRAFSASPRSAIVVNSAGCGAMLKGYPNLLRNTPLHSEASAFADRVKDVTELLADCGPASGAPLALKVAYDPPCHLLHAQQISDAPLRVMRTIPGLELTMCDGAELCCGSAGTYSLTQPKMAEAVLNRKLEPILESGVDVVASGNPGCIIQIGAGLRKNASTVGVAHPVELLDSSYQRAGLYQTATSHND